MSCFIAALRCSWHLIWTCRPLDSTQLDDLKVVKVDVAFVDVLKRCVDSGRAVASWFVTLIRMHMHAGSSPDWGTVRTGTLGKSPHPVVLCPVSPMSEDACAWC